MIKTVISIKTALFTAVVLMLCACGTESPKEEPKAAVVVQDTASDAEIPQVTYSLPSPLQIASIFKKSGMKYKDGVTSPIKDPLKYRSNLSKSLNLGIYSADLCYVVLNKQQQEAMRYMKLSRQTADKLGMGAVFDQDNLSKRFEKNIGNEDSLAHIISELQMVLDTYLDENNQKQITSIAFAGAWIESLFIASKVFEKNNEQTLNKKLSEQMTILESILNALKIEEKKDPAINELIVDLQGVKNIYDAQSSEGNADKASGSNEKIKALTDDEIASLITKIQELREKFIKG